MILNDLILRSKFEEAENYVGLISDDFKRVVLSAYLIYRKDQFRESLKILEQLTGDRYLTFRNIIRALCYFGLSDQNFRKIIDLVDESRDILEERYVTMNYLFLKSRVYSRTDPARSIQTTKEQIQLAVELDDTWMIITSYGDMGVFYRYLGHYEQSEFFTRRKLKLLENIPNNGMKFRGHANLAMALFHRRKFTESLEEIREAEKYMEGERAVVISQLLFIRMYIQLISQDHDEGEKTYSKILKILANAPHNQMTAMMQNLTHGIYFKNKRRLKHNFTAQVHLEKVVNEEVLDYEIYFIALVNMIDLLVSEYAHLGQPDVLDEINYMEKKLESFMNTSYRGMYSFQIYQLRARLLFIEKNIDGAMAVIEEGILNTEDEEAKNELKILQTQFYQTLQEWEKLSVVNNDLMQNFIKAEILEYLSMVIDIVKK